MNPRIKGALEWLRIIDVHDGQVSLTNVALIIVLGKLVFAPAVGLTEIGGLLIALASYQGKKVINRNAESPEEDPLKPQVEEMKTLIDDIQSKVTALAMQAGIKKLGQ